jgi:hypothetical protein
MRRGGYDYSVDAALEEFAVGIETHKATVLRYVSLLFSLLLELLAAGVKPLFEDVSQGDKADVPSSIRRVDGSLGAAPAATNQANTDDAVAGCVGYAADGRLGNQGGSSQGGGRAQE